MIKTKTKMKSSKKPVSSTLLLFAGNKMAEALRMAIYSARSDLQSSLAREDRGEIQHLMAYYQPYRSYIDALAAWEAIIDDTH